MREPIPKPKKKKKYKTKTPKPIGDKKCYCCGSTVGLEKHHCFFGPNRGMSNKFRCIEWLCNNHHRGQDGVHRGNQELDIELKQKHQIRLEIDGMSRKRFIKTFGRSYL